jgi:hypothetical protein
MQEVINWFTGGLIPGWIAIGGLVAVAVLSIVNLVTGGRRKRRRIA